MISIGKNYDRDDINHLEIQEATSSPIIESEVYIAVIQTQNEVTINAAGTIYLQIFESGSIDGDVPIEYRLELPHPQKFYGNRVKYFLIPIKNIHFIVG